MRRFGVVGAVVFWLATQVAMATPLRVRAVVTGEGHDLFSVSATLSWLLKRHDDVELTLSRDAGALNAQSLQGVHVVILYAPGASLGSESERVLSDFVQAGGGLIYIHHSPGSSFAEGLPGNVVVEVTQPSHPLMRSIPAFQVTDAPGQAGDVPAEMLVLARQRNGQALVWVEQKGKGRVFYTALGHSSACWNHPHFQQVILNALYWCAGRPYPSVHTPRPPRGFTSLFNGVNLEGWGEVGPPVWYAQDGVMVCTGMSEGGGWLRSNRMYRNFILRLEYRIAPGGNSGIFLRAPHYGRSSRLAMELQVQDDGTSPPSNTCTSAVYSVVAPRVNPAKPAGEWNRVEITLKDRNLRVVWNGQLVHDIHLDDPALNANLPRTHLLYRRPNSGYIGLQNHRSLVEFRNIFIRELQ